MAEFKVIEGGAVKAKAGLTVRAASLLFVLEHLGQAIFGGMWGAFAEPKVDAILASVQIPQLEATVEQLMMVNMLPLVLALLGVLTPLFGWWIYSRIPTERQTETGWAIAGFFILFDALLSLVGALFSTGQMDAVAWGGFGFLLVITAAILVLWIMFFMGAGFLVAKMFKSKL